MAIAPTLLFPTVQTSTMSVPRLVGYNSFFRKNYIEIYYNNRHVKFAGVNSFGVRDEKLFSAMCNWSNHCLHHLLPSERDTGHDLRRRRHSYQLVCYNFSSTRRCFVIRMLYDSL